MSDIKMPLVYTEEEIERLKEQHRGKRLVKLTQVFKDKKSGQKKTLELVITETTEANKDAYSSGVSQGNLGPATREFLAQVVVGRKYEDVLEFLSEYGAVCGRLIMKYQEEFEGGASSLDAKEL